MPPAIDGGDDFVGIGRPDEGLWLVVGLGEEAVDGGLEVDDRVKDTALQAASGELGEVAFDGIEPGGGCRGEVEGKAGMAFEPSADLFVLVGGVVVEDDMNQLSGREFGLDGIEKADEFLMTVPLHAATDNLAFQHVEGGKQRGRPVPLVVVGHRLAAALLDRQAGLGSIEGLDLALLVDRQHDGVRRRIDIDVLVETDLTFPRKVDTGLRGFRLGLLWGEIADGGMDPLTIVVAFDIGEQVATGGIPIGVFALVNEFGFQGAEETLHRRIVPAIRLAAHRLGDGGGPQDIAVVAGGVLAAAIGMMGETRPRAAALDRHGERRDGEFGAHVVAHCPADHLAGEQVEDHGQVEPGLAPF